MNSHSINGRIGALERWARTTKAERQRQAARAQAGLVARFEREADPEGRMSDADRIAAGERLRRAHMLRMARLSAAARRRRG